MATRTKGAYLPVAVIFVLLVIVFDPVGGAVSGVIHDVLAGENGLVGTGDQQLMVAGSDLSLVQECGVRQLVQQRRCDDLKVVVMDAARMPFIARNISIAWEEGHKSVLVRDTDQGNRRWRYEKNCRSGFSAVYEHGSCDEYPARHEARCDRTGVGDLR